MVTFPRRFVTLSLGVVVLLGLVPACASASPAAPTAVQVAPTTAPAKPTAAPAAPVAPTASAPASAAPTAAPPAKVTEYNVNVFTDLSGPTSDVQKAQSVGQKIAWAWWSDTRGKELGVKLNMKWYDMRFDSSVVASLWPSSLADKPILATGIGSGDFTAIGERAIADKVPLFIGGSGFGATWKPNQWAFQFMATFTHDVAAFLSWKASTWNETRPMRFAMLLANQVPSVYEVAAGMNSVMAQNLFGGKVELVGTEFAPNAPTDLSNEIKRLLDKKPDYIIILVVPQATVMAKRALLQYKSTVPVVLGGSGNGLESTGAGLGSLKDLEGDYEVDEVATALDTNIEGYKVYQQYNGNASLGSVPWGQNAIIGMLRGLLPVRAVERAAKAVGADKLTGQAVYDATKNATFTSQDMLGLVGDLTYSGDATFPTKGMKMHFVTVKDGKLALASDWVPAPDIAKW